MEPVLCPRCGQPLPEGAAVCPACGQPAASDCAARPAGTAQAAAASVVPTAPADAEATVFAAPVNAPVASAAPAAPDTSSAPAAPGAEPPRGAPALDNGPSGPGGPVPPAYDAPHSAGPMQPAPGPRYAPQTPQEPDGGLSTAQYFWTLLLFAVPVLGLVLMLYWSFGSTTCPARRRLARASLIKTGVLTVLAVLFLACLAAVAAVFGRSLLYALERYLYSGYVRY